MAQHYKHSQTGYAIIVPCLFFILFVVPFLPAGSYNLITAGVLLLLILIFGTLSVTIDEQFIEVRMT